MEENKINLYDYIWNQISCYDETYKEEIGLDKLDNEDVYSIMYNILDRTDMQEAVREEIEEYANWKNYQESEVK